MPRLLLHGWRSAISSGRHAAARACRKVTRSARGREVQEGEQRNQMRGRGRDQVRLHSASLHSFEKRTTRKHVQHCEGMRTDWRKEHDPPLLPSTLSKPLAPVELLQRRALLLTVPRRHTWSRRRSFIPAGREGVKTAVSVQPGTQIGDPPPKPNGSRLDSTHSSAVRFSPFEVVNCTGTPAGPVPTGRKSLTAAPTPPSQPTPPTSREGSRPACTGAGGDL